MIAEILAQAEDFLLAHGPIVVGVALFLENAAGLGIFVPGISILIFAGYFVSTGDLSATWVGIAAYLGTLSGDQVNYLIGRYGASHLPFVRRNQFRVDDIRKSLERRSPTVMYFFQFPPYGRVLVPMTFGVMCFPYYHWLLIDFIAALLFILAYGGGGFLLGTALSEILDVDTLSMLIQGVIGGIVLVWMVLFSLNMRRRWKDRKRSDDRKHRLRNARSRRRHARHSRGVRHTNGNGNGNGKPGGRGNGGRGSGSAGEDDKEKPHGGWR